jgi:hypothetical protein
MSVDQYGILMAIYGRFSAVFNASVIDTDSQPADTIPVKISPEKHLTQVNIEAGIF